MSQGREIAVIGMAGRFPGARDLEEFWRNLEGGVESITFFSERELVDSGVDPALLRHPDYVPAAPVIEGIERFDAPFFGYSPREAELIDPQQRLLLTCAWEALEDAGYAGGVAGRRVGVYGGSSLNTYLLHNLAPAGGLLDAPAAFFQTLIANDKDHLTTRIAYKLNLKGPAVTVQTACSTSLVAVALACQSLLDGECDLALAGGVSVRVPQREGYLFQKGMIVSPDGHCRPFDRAGRGTVFGDGAGMVLLKRLDEALADGDPIHALIRGAALNNDGSLKVGYTAPSVDGQAEVIAEALALAGVEPETISYVEAHGTATELGDPIEVAALAQAFHGQAGRSGGNGHGRSCAIGSVKSNIGHLQAAAGVAGLIKTVLALRHRRIPPSLHFMEPNPGIDFAATPFQVNTALTDWTPPEGVPRRAGVSSFGIGGTNAHVVLEEAPAAPPPSPSSRQSHLLLLSARTPSALDALTARLARRLAGDPGLDLADVAYTLQAGRKAFACRRAVVCDSVADAVRALEPPDPERVRTHALRDAEERPLAFLFPGQGTQHPCMGADLYRQERGFRSRFDRCAEILLPHLDLDLRELLCAPAAPLDPERLARTALAQPALFALEHSLAMLWMEWGAVPRALLGHSVGELAAACVAGVFTLEDGLALAAARGRLMQEAPAGSMLSVPLGVDETLSLAREGLELAAVNGPAQCVLAGPVTVVAQLERELRAAGLEARRLATSHAFHSAAMDGAAQAFVEEVRRMALHPPRIPFLSNVTGTWITPEQATDPGYWGRQLRATVLFGAGLAELRRAGDPILLETGPGHALGNLARQGAGQAVFASLPRWNPEEGERRESAFLQETLGRLWLLGLPMAAAGFWKGESRRRVSLPTYPFEERRHWIEAPRRAAGAVAVPAGALAVPLWRQTPALPAPAPSALAGARWLLLADPAGLADRLASLLASHGAQVVTLRASDPLAADLPGLLSTLWPGGAPDHVVHLWSLGAAPDDEAALGPVSLLRWRHALTSLSSPGEVRLTLVTDGLAPAIDGGEARPVKAVLLGLTGGSARPACLVALAGPRSGDDAGALLAELAAPAGPPLVALWGRRRWLPSQEPALPAAAGRNLAAGGLYLVITRSPRLGEALAELLRSRASVRVTLAASADPGDFAHWAAALAAPELKGVVHAVELEDDGLAPPGEDGGAGLARRVREAGLRLRALRDAVAGRDLERCLLLSAGGPAGALAEAFAADAYDHLSPAWSALRLSGLAAAAPEEEVVQTMGAALDRLLEAAPTPVVHFTAAAPAAEGEPEALPDSGRLEPHVGPRSETERVAVGIWQRFFGLERIGIHDDFFELGGTSLLATQLAGRLGEAFGLELTVQDLLTAPTVARLAQRVDERRLGGPEDELRRALERIESLPEAEVRRLLAQAGTEESAR